jgi:hypothetical protein
LPTHVSNESALIPSVEFSFGSGIYIAGDVPRLQMKNPSTAMDESVQWHLMSERRARLSLMSYHHSVMAFFVHTCKYLFVLSYTAQAGIDSIPSPLFSISRISLKSCLVDSLVWLL